MSDQRRKAHTREGELERERERESESSRLTILLESCFSETNDSLLKRSRWKQIELIEMRSMFFTSARLCCFVTIASLVPTSHSIVLLLGRRRGVEGEFL